MITTTHTIHFTKHPIGRKPRPTPSATSPGRIPRVAKLMAIAIRFQKLVDDGVVADYSALARLAKVSQPRMTQIMNLLLLAPDIQEALLFLPRVTKGKPPLNEKMLRPIAAEMIWERQTAMWNGLRMANA